MSGGSKTTYTKTEPWDKQKDALEQGLREAPTMYGPGRTDFAPDYYPSSTVAGFDPAQTAAQSELLTYATGPRVSGLQSAAETTGTGGMGYGLGAMSYGAGLAGPLSEAQYAGLTPYSATQYGQLLSGEVDPTTFDPLADAYRRQAMNQLTGEVLPGIRQQITQAQPGGGTRGDIIQANAVASAQEQISNNLAQAEFQAYQQAQDRSLAAAQMGLTAQQTGMGYGMGGAEAASRAVGQYDVERPMTALQNYLASISGEFGGTSSATGPGGPSPLVSALSGAGSGFLMGGVPGAVAGGALGLGMADWD